MGIEGERVPAKGSADMKMTLDVDEKRRIVNRLKRLEGQVRGLQRMVEEERECHEILALASGVRSALDASTDAILEQYLDRCSAGLGRGEVDVRQVVNAVKLARG